MYYNKGDLEKARDCYERALEIRKEKLGPNHVDVVSCYINLGNVYYNKGDSEKSRDYYEQVLEIRKEKLGPNHVDVADSYIDLGDVYYDKGDSEKARDYYEPEEEWSLYRDALRLFQLIIYY